MARLARNLVTRCRDLTAAINALEREIRECVSGLVPRVMALLGCGALSAAKIVGEVGRISDEIYRRLRADEAFTAMRDPGLPAAA